MGAPFFEYRWLIEKHKVEVFSPNFALYSDMSDRVMQILLSFSEETEIYSIDEAFIPITHHTVEDFNRLKEQVKKWTGIPVSIGLAPTKTLAKLANHYAKNQPSNIYSFIDHPDVDPLFANMDISSIWGVGRQTAEKLKLYNIHTVLQFKNLSQEWVRSKFHLPALRTLLEIQGTPCYYPNTEEELQKSLIHSSSFASPIDSFQHLEETVAHFAAKAAEKLRERGLLTSVICLYLRADNGSDQQSLPLNFATNTTAVLIEAARLLLKRMFRKTSYKKAGIFLWQLSSTKQQQLDFTAEDNSKALKLQQTVDQINNQYGDRSLFHLAEGIKKPWLSRRDHLTPKYSTDMAQLLKINI